MSELRRGYAHMLAMTCGHPIIFESTTVRTEIVRRDFRLANEACSTEFERSGSPQVTVLVLVSDAECDHHHRRRIRFSIQ